jgi:hypothetical protein
LAIFRGAHRFAVCMGLFIYHTFVIAWRDRAGSGQGPPGIMRVQLFVALDGAGPGTGDVRGLSLAAVVCMTVQVPGLSL